MVYEEDGDFLVFEAPMGVTPHDVYVPPASTWSSKVPQWASTKRSEILDMIRSVRGVGQIVEDEHAWVETKPF